MSDGDELDRAHLARQALAWRDKAEELRTSGECASNPTARAILLQLADDRDALAATAERLLGRPEPGPFPAAAGTFHPPVVDTARLEELLTRAEEILARGAEEILRQQAIIDGLERDGHATVTARDLLRVYEQTQAVYKAHCELLRDALGPPPPVPGLSGPKGAGAARPFGRSGRFPL